MNRQKIITWLLVFLLFFMAMQWLNKPPAPAPELTADKLGITPVKINYVSGEEVVVKVRNNTPESIILPSTCPKNPLRVLVWSGEKFLEKSAETKLQCQGVSEISLAPQTETKISFKFWNHALFGDEGRYKVELTLEKGTTTGTFISPEFTVEPAGALRKFFRTFLYQPLYNVLVFLVDTAPGRDLGFAIIILTLLIRLILLIPSQRAMVSQRRMQELQPKLEALRKKYAGNQERIAQETMQLWKENKVNPFGTCLPILIQFPILIALFYVIQNGLNPDNLHYLYTPLKDVDLTTIRTNFLGILELTRVNIIVLPLMVGGLQFFQLKLAMARKKTEDKPETEKSEMETMNKTMTYMMPVMIAIFTASVPAGVGLYWGVSTLFAIGQQFVANKKK